MTKRYFEFSEGSSNKFWEVWVEGNQVFSRYGKIGASGQVTVKDEGSPAAAQKLHDKLVREKTGKGYVEKGGGTAAVPAKSAAKSAPKASKAPAKPAKAAKAPAKTGPVLVGDAPIRSLHGSFDGAWLASTHTNQHVLVWDLNTGQCRCDVRVGGSGMKFVSSAAFSLDGTKLASGSSSVTVVDLAAAKPQPTKLGAAKEELRSIDWTPEGLLIANNDNVQGAKNQVALLDPASGKVLKAWKFERVESAAFVPGSSVVIALGGRHDYAQQKLVRFDLRTNAEVEIDAPNASSFVATRMGIWLVDGEELVLLDPKTLARVRAFPSGGRYTWAADWDGKVLFAAHKSMVERLDPANGKVKAKWPLPTGIPGITEHIAAMNEKEKYSKTRYDDKAPDVGGLHVSPAGDRVAAATTVAIAVWSVDGKLLLSPSAKS